MKLSLLIITVFAMISPLANAQYSQYFIPPVDDGLVMTAKEVYAVSISGDTTRGKINSATMIDGQLRSFTIKKADKSKVKFKSADVKLLAIKATEFMNWTSAMSTPNIQRAAELDFDKIMDREWIIFDQALLPNKNKYALMQLLNPDFDSKIKVYVNPNANETGNFSVSGLTISGGEDTSYLVVTDGNQSELYKKSKYNKEALTRLFKDCDVFAENYEGEKFKWRDFSEHVFIYDQLCQ